MHIVGLDSSVSTNVVVFPELLKLLRLGIFDKFIFMGTKCSACTGIFW